MDSGETIEDQEHENRERKSFPLDSSAKEESILTKIVRATTSSRSSYPNQSESNFQYNFRELRSTRRCKVEPIEGSELALRHPMLYSELSRSDDQDHDQEDESSTRYAWDLSSQGSSSNVMSATVRYRESKPVSFSIFQALLDQKFDFEICARKFISMSISLTLRLNNYSVLARKFKIDSLSH